MTRDDFDRAFEDLGDGATQERLARQRVRLIEWERSRAPRVDWYRSRPWVAVLGAAAMAVALFGWRETVSKAPALQLAASESAVPKVAAALPSGAVAVPVVAQAAPATGRAVLAGAVGDRPLAADQWLDASQGPVAMKFAEGSLIELDAGSRGRLTELGADGLSLSIEAGHLTAQITPGGPYRWLVHAGPHVVRVVGTAFSVDWQPENAALVVAVTRGKVEVSGGESGSSVKQLVAGETLRVTGAEAAPGANGLRAPSLGSGARHARSALVAAPAIPDVLPGPEPRSAQPKSSAAPTGAGVWKGLAEKGEYRQAYAAAEGEGIERLAAGSAASDLLLLADAARLSGAPDAARQVLLVLRSRFPAHPNASVAGFVLGRLAYEQNNDREAVRWLRGYLAGGASGPLAEGARSRLLVALKRLGDIPAAKAAATDYLQHHPRGRNAASARAVLSE